MFQEVILAAHISLMKASDSATQETGTKNVDLLTGLHSTTRSAVKYNGGMSSFFLVNTEVRQGRILAPSLSTLLWTGYLRSVNQIVGLNGFTMLRFTMHVKIWPLLYGNYQDH